MSLADYPLVRHWIGTDGDRLVIRTGKVDIGQRISSALARIAHEELSLPLERIEVAPVTTAGLDEGITSGSLSIEHSGSALRAAAATLRAHVTDLAVARSGGTPKDWSWQDGTLTRPGLNRPLPVLALIAEADPDLAADPTLAPQPPAATAPHMRGISDLVTGRYTFLPDLDLPGMRHARVLRPPHARATLEALDDSAAEKLADRDIRLIRDGSFLALAGPDEWAVTKALATLAAACTWDTPPLPEDDVFARLTAETARRFPVTGGVPAEGPVRAPLEDTLTKARFERPYLLHAALAPSAALAEWDGAALRIRSHSQGIHALRDSIATSLDLPADAVEITHHPNAGCYGHNGADDAALDAALIARAIPGTPILLKYTRADEHGWEPFAPAMALDLAARLVNGQIEAIDAEVFSDTHRGRPRAGANDAGPRRLLSNRFRDPAWPAPEAAPNMNRHGGMHRNLDPAYTIPEKRLIKNLVAGLPHRTSALRCLGNTTNIFGLESLMDMLAEEAGQDPFAFRRVHLDDPRSIAVLDRLEALARDTPRAMGHGIAFAQYKNAMTRTAVAVDIDLTDASEIRLRRAIVVADAGRVIDPEGLAAQLEGGFLQGASIALHEEITWDRGGITSRDWDSYPVLRFDNVPEITVEIIADPGNPPAGAGEATPGPAIAAIANALCDATGLRMFRTPFTPDALTRAALAG
ncbi:molybdopterin cofactor-binding domain-containing protein [Oceaniglobus roseus]|uniref:molybdopterin cofactor-binding domain-containing protein n=1 Tax=Oceaniglobus roseus TaxID=1737570 RepID=UPI000C7F1900|nr:molybdopterin cofactor-binding domain-containing protein [Kandeliimicrobium roseum]